MGVARSEPGLLEAGPELATTLRERRLFTHRSLRLTIAAGTLSVPSAGPGNQRRHQRETVVLLCRVSACGRRPYVATSPIDSLKPGMYELRVTVKQGAALAQEHMLFTVEE